MKVFDNLQQWRQFRRTLAGSVGFVPTMGALHEGHASLLKRSAAENAVTVLSIFLNPTQFNNAGDLEAYPCTLEQDLKLACSLGAGVVLLPRYEEIYADGFRYQIEEKEFSRELCGAHRSGHFTGVLTVVMKLLNLVSPDRAYFGEKDYQQYLLIRDMCEAFFLDVDIVPCETIRAPDGLALSSRNALLDVAGRERAAELNQLIRSDLGDAAVVQLLCAGGFDVDYVITRQGRRFVAATVSCGERSVRLIDNVVLGVST